MSWIESPARPDWRHNCATVWVRFAPTPCAPRLAPREIWTTFQTFGSLGSLASWTTLESKQCNGLGSWCGHVLCIPFGTSRNLWTTGWMESRARPDWSQNRAAVFVRGASTRCAPHSANCPERFPNFSRCQTGCAKRRRIPKLNRESKITGKKEKTCQENPRGANEFPRAS